MTHRDHPAPGSTQEGTDRLTDLEGQVVELIGREPKDFARAAALLYDVLRTEGREAEARYVAGIFDTPAMVLYQIPDIVRALRGADPTEIAALMDRLDDVERLVVMTLDGDTNAEVVRRIAALRTAVSQRSAGTGSDEAVAAAGERLTHLVNAFFFDRLTASPTLRDYVVHLELGA